MALDPGSRGPGRSDLAVGCRDRMTAATGLYKVQKNCDARLEAPP